MQGVTAALEMSVADIELLIGLVIIGIAGWRWKRGDFYKAVATEKTAESDKLRAENERLRSLTDITPILNGLHQITAALERHARTTNAVFEKVADMNGSLRASTVAMEALANRLITDEAARGLLAEAAKSSSERRRTA